MKLPADYAGNVLIFYAKWKLPAHYAGNRKKAVPFC